MAFLVPMPDRDDVDETGTPVGPDDDDDGLLVFRAVDADPEAEGVRDDEVDVWDGTRASTDAPFFDEGALAVVLRDDAFSTEVVVAAESLAFRVGLFFA